MNRRLLLKSLPAATLLSSLPAVGLRAQPGAPSGTQHASGWRTFEVTTRVQIQKPDGETRVWIPLPLSQDTDYFRTLGHEVLGNYERAQVVVEPGYRSALAVAMFKPTETSPAMDVVTRFMTRERNVPLDRGAGMAATRDELTLALRPTALLPTDGIVRRTAHEITRGVRGDVAQARAIYDWIVERTQRNPKTRGCGLGDIKTMLETGNLSGKCADLNALFVGLCRAAGIPARDVYGIRVSDSPRGYKSMGRSGDITRAQHCRAEFYAQGIGWVPVDPADVRKVVLEERPDLTLQDPLVASMGGFLFGNWEGNWLAYNYAHDLVLPGSQGDPLPFLMYPQAETGGRRLDALDPDSFRYRILSHELGV
jgi:transglutaminase-like putative cysteine protease